MRILCEKELAQVYGGNDEPVEDVITVWGRRVQGQGFSTFSAHVTGFGISGFHSAYPTIGPNDPGLAWENMMEDPLTQAEVVMWDSDHTDLTATPVSLGDSLNGVGAFLVSDTVTGTPVGFWMDREGSDGGPGTDGLFEYYVYPGGFM